MDNKLKAGRFTPNADGSNDKFKITSNLLSTLTSTIYNRWGEKIFEFTSANNEWDGTYNGNKCAEGTYFYTINAKGFDGKDYPKRTGIITLLR